MQKQSLNLIPNSPNPIRKNKKKKIKKQEMETSCECWNMCDSYSLHDNNKSNQIIKIKNHGVNKATPYFHHDLLRPKTNAASWRLPARGFPPLVHR